MSGFQGTNTTEGGIGFSSLGLSDNSALVQILTAEDIAPGKPPSYQLCKTIYAFHPLGAKIVEAPVRLAQSQQREISVPAGPESALIPAFWREWKTIGGKNIDGSDISGDIIIRNLVVTKKIYGIASLIVGERGKTNSETPLDLASIADADLYFNVLDPLNTAGSLVLDQDPNSPDFQKARAVRVGNKVYHPSRTVVLMNEMPIYLEFTDSAFGFSGRSAYQRALFPLKTFLQTMITDQWVAIKVGLLIAKMKAPGPIINNKIMNFFGIKRSQLQGGITGNVLSIGEEEAIESLNFQNLEGPAAMVRNNSLKNVAMAAGMPSKLLEQEEMIGGMAEGTEDAKQIAHFIDGEREEMEPPYRFMDRITMRRAWSPDFYKTIQRDYPDYKKVPYETAFYDWQNSFEAKWPNLLEEPDSEKLKAEESRFKSAVAIYEVMSPNLDPDNKARLTEWLADEVNARKELFSSKLDIDVDTLIQFGEEQQEQQQLMATAAQGGNDQEPKPQPFGANT